MSELSRKWSFLDQAAVAHRPQCDAVTMEAMNDAAFGIDMAQAGDAVVGYALAMRPVYDALKRVIGQAGGLLILAETTGKADAVDLPSLANVEDGLCKVRELLAARPAPAGLACHKQGLEDAARLAATAIAALRALGTDAMELGPALDALSRSYRLLQRASDSRFGLMMVDFRHACCTCGAIGRA